jgi:alanyl-tRNA synthetase
VLQNVESNYEIDLFHPFWEALTKLSGFKYTGQYPRGNAADPVAEAANPQLRHDIAFRVIADHIRCLTFALTDGAVPSNEGRGYVLRRILRRAVRFGRQTLELKDPFLHTLVPIVVEAMGGAFPELKKNPGHVVEIIKDEELSFGRTLDRGIKLFEEAAAQVVGREYAAATGVHFFSWERTSQLTEDKSEVFSSAQWNLGFETTSQPRETKFLSIRDVEAELRSSNRSLGRITSDDAFKLHDTYGFPIDLTRIMAEERGMSVDLEGYEKLMERARELARSGGEKGDARLYELSPDALAQLSRTGVKPTDDSAKFNAAPIGAKVVAIWDGSKLIDTTHGAEAAGQGVAVVLDQTNFYAEMGGQVGDTGELRGATGGVLDVSTTRTAGAYVLHVGQMIEGHLKVGEHVTATLAGVRPRTEKNHTTTHLANWALREVLGEGVQQKGSLVDPEKLRFDFSHGKAVAEEELARVETLVDQCIRKNLPVYAEEAPQEQALKINGLRAVFGEKYPPMVRVVSVGVPVSDLLKDPANAKWRQFSIEFCGGTHLRTSGDAAAFVITAEESVSKGIRRIVGLTGEAARQAQELASQLGSTVEKAKSLPESEIPTALASIQKSLAAPGLPLRAKRAAQGAVAELQAKYKTWEKANKAQQGGGAADVAETASKLLETASDLGGGKLVVGEVPGANDDTLRGVMDSLRKRTPAFGILLGSAGEGRVSFISAVSDDLIAKGLKAGDWIRETAKVAGGGGGGRPQMAQAGGKDPSKLQEALNTARTYATGVVGG